MAGEKGLCLSERLLAVAALVPPGSRLADIGTDHAYLPIWLMQQRRIVQAIACDVGEGPLRRARESVARCGMENAISLRLGDGLACVAPSEIDAAAIAGMGGETIVSILSAAPWINDGRYTLVLQPMTRAALLRQWLAENGFCFLCERLVYENHTYFPVMALRGGVEQKSLSAGQAWGGVALQSDPLQGAALDALLRQRRAALAGLERSHAPENREKAAQERALIAQLVQRKEEWLHADRT